MNCEGGEDGNVWLLHSFRLVVGFVVGFDFCLDWLLPIDVLANMRFGNDCTTERKMLPRL